MSTSVARLIYHRYSKRLEMNQLLHEHQRNNLNDRYPLSPTKRLLAGLTENGFGKAQLEEMQKIISAENSDLFDVLAFVAYASAPLTREERAARAKVIISTHFNTKQQTFLDFVLSHYVRAGVEELNKEKLAQLLRLRYHGSIHDAVADLGQPAEISEVFVDFQKWLYLEEAEAA